MRKILSTCCLLALAGLAALAAAGDASSAGQRPRVIVVDGRDPNASDANSGSPSSPVSTIARGLSLAAGANRSGVPVRVLVRPGSYRESAILSRDPGATSAPITITGVGRVVMSGSDVWSGWSAETGGTYTHPWPYRWGLSPLPPGWQGPVGPYLAVNPVIRRREMVFVNGASLSQVMSRDELTATPNSFFVDEAHRRILVHDPRTDLLHATVEVGIRPTLLTVQSRRNVTIEHVTFRHAATELQTGAAVVVVSSKDVRLIGDRFVWNNSTGLGLADDVGMRISNMSASHDGVNGLTGFRLTDFLVEKSQASYNGWRSARGWNLGDHSSAIDANFIDFAAGQKFFELRNATFRDFRAVGNLTSGLWFDSDNAGVTLQHVELVGNLTQGVMVEASQGPFSISRSWVCGNETGILVNNAANGRVERNVLAGNLLGQLYLAGSATPRPVPEHDTGLSAHLLGANWVMLRNKIGAEVGSPAVGSLPDPALWTAFIGSFRSDRNQYSSPNTSAVFQIAGSRYATLAEWRAATGSDRHSTFSATKTRCRVPPFQALTRSPELPGSSLGLGLWAVGAALAGLVLVGLLILRLAR